MWVPHIYDLLQLEDQFPLFMKINIHALPSNSSVCLKEKERKKLERETYNWLDQCKPMTQEILVQHVLRTSSILIPIKFILPYLSLNYVLLVLYIVLEGIPRER